LRMQRGYAAFCGVVHISVFKRQQRIRISAYLLFLRLHDVDFDIFRILTLASSAFLTNKF
ncbi:MAG: hypothetical protein U5M50_15745, partial [Sphingobium sp.]|nr:hypothetical protein [Sphingobium sp.]